MTQQCLARLPQARARLERRAPVDQHAFLLHVREQLAKRLPVPLIHVPHVVVRLALVWGRNRCVTRHAAQLALHRSESSSINSHQSADLMLLLH